MPVGESSTKPVNHVTTLIPKKIERKDAVDAIKKALPYVQKSIERVGAIAELAPIPGLEYIFKTIEWILSYYDKESQISKTITSLGVLVANVGVSVGHLVETENSMLGSLVVGIEGVVKEVVGLVVEESAALKEKNPFKKVFHVFTKAEKVEEQLVDLKDRLAQAVGDFDLRLQICNYNSIAQLAQEFILLNDTVENGFGNLADLVRDGNMELRDLILVVLKQLSLGQTQQSAPIVNSAEPYEYLGSLLEPNGPDERTISSVVLEVSAVCHDVKEFYEDKLEDTDNFILKLRYFDKKLKKKKTVNLNKRMLVQYIGSRQEDENAAVVLIEK
ncbi:UNVERIFIED_CONTAM: hypothetical protein HDU68_008350, partial [Siphonaria sp. JEL0065]